MLCHPDAGAVHTGGGRLGRRRRSRATVRGAGGEENGSRAVDLLPGTPSIVRRAQIAIKTAGREQVIGLWIPGEVPQRLEGGAAFRVPPEASMLLRIHYQKPRASAAPIAH